MVEGGKRPPVSERTASLEPEGPFGPGLLSRLRTFLAEAANEGRPVPGEYGLAEQFQVSRRSIREALLQLEFESSGQRSPVLAGEVNPVWLKALPKAEVHVHLEGCIPVPLVLACAQRVGALPSRMLTATKPVLPDLASLLGYLDWSCALLDQAEDLTAVAYETAVRASTGGVGHVDAIVNPTHWPAWRNRLPALLDAFDRGFTRAEREGHATAALCVSLKRNQSQRAALALVAELADLGHRRVAAQGDPSRHLPYQQRPPRDRQGSPSPPRPSVAPPRGAPLSQH